MDLGDQQQTLEYIAKAHALVEKNYLNNPAVPNSEEWLNERRMLLADISLHLSDACVRDELDVEKIKRYLHSLLIIAHDFAPEVELKKTAQKLLPDVE